MPNEIYLEEFLLFPALISVRSCGGVYVDFIDEPDANFEADSFEEALGRTTTELYKTFRNKRIVSQKDGIKARIAEPTPFVEAVKIATEERCYLHLVPISQAAVWEYARKYLTIPAWLDKLGLEANLNFSAILAEGVARELGITGVKFSKNKR